MAVAQPRLSIGHTCITWADPVAENGIKYISELGFKNIEIFAWVLKAFYDSGRADICKQYGIPLISSYYSVDIANPDMRGAEMAKLAEWTDILVRMGGKYATFGGNFVDRRAFSFKEDKKYIVDFVNETAKLLYSKGIRLNFHPHTGTPIETTEEIESFFDAVNTDYVGFAPDIGQLQKGGCDPMRFVKDYFSILKLVHLKDYGGNLEFDADGKEIDTTGYACYSPLGQGVVDIEGILDYLENSTFNGPVMVELDCSDSMPLTAEQAVKINRDYLEKLGYVFIKQF